MKGLQMETKQIKMECERNMHGIQKEHRGNTKSKEYKENIKGIQKEYKWNMKRI